MLGLAALMQRRAFLLGTGGLLLAPRVWAAEAGYLKGQTLRVIIPNSAGSATDNGGRLFMKHLAARLPDTRLMIENIDGANSRIGLVDLWQSEPDGLTIGFPPNNIIFSELLGEDELPISLPDFGWLGSMSQDRRGLALSRKSGARSLADILRGDRPILVGAEARSSGPYTNSLLLNVLLKTWLRPVTGYKADTRTLALISGEVDCLINTLAALRPALDADGADVVLQLSGPPLPAELGTVPRLDSLPYDPAYGWIVEMLQRHSRVGITIATGPGTPGDRLSVLRGLFAEVCNDPAFVTEATALGMEIIYSTAEATVETVRVLLADKAATTDRLRAALECGRQRADTGVGC